MQVNVSSIIGFLCLIGCLYQIYDITQLYLQFKVRREVAYDFTTYAELPAIDIMVPMAMALNYSLILGSTKQKSTCEQFNKKYKELNYTIDDSHGRCDDAILLRILEQDPFAISLNISVAIKVLHILLASIHIRDQFLDILVPKTGNSTDIDCTETRYYNGLAIFMRISCLKGTKPVSDNNILISRHLGYPFKLRHSFGIYFGIRLSDPADLPVFDRSKYFMITREPGSFPLVTISFVKTVMRSLEYPYETDCRHYNKDESISKCMTEHTLVQSPPYLDKFAIYEWDEYPGHLGLNGNNKGGLRNGSEKVNQVELDEFIKCNQQAAATQCEKTDYLLEGKISETNNKSEYGWILFKQSWKANIYLSVHPILPWDQYVIYILSIASIWFGISMHDNVFKILNVLRSLKSRILSLIDKRNVKN